MDKKGESRIFFSSMFMLIGACIFFIALFMNLIGGIKELGLVIAMVIGALFFVVGTLAALMPKK